MPTSVAFDARDDVAVLRVGGLAGVPALRFAPDPQRGQDAAVLGFPRNGPYDVRGARLGSTRDVLSEDAYGRGPVTRSIATFRATVRPGNSGGPVVDGQGRVLATVFATARARRRAHRLRGAGRRRRPVLQDAAAQAGPSRPAPAPPERARRRRRRALPCGRMPKTLVIAEKPSVGRDLARVLPGPFEKKTGSADKTERYLEGPEHVISWAVGHLVQLADPDEYDEKFKKWRMADLPIVPSRFKLVVRDERSQKQMTVVRQLLKRDDIDVVVNACDAGREGELIFAYLYEQAKAKLPVKRLWLSSMTNEAMRDALANLRDGDELHQLEEAARSRSEADWIVGMNATRAATIRLRSSFDGAVSLGARADADAGDPHAARGGDPRLRPREVLAGRRDVRGRRRAPLRGPLPRRAPSRGIGLRRGGRGDRRGRPRAGAATITKLEKAKRTERAPMLYDLTSLQREANTRYGFSARRTLAAAQRCYEEHKALTYPRTSSRFLTSDMVAELKPIAQLVGRRDEYAKAAAYVTGLDLLPLGRVVDDAKVGDHHAIIPTRAEHKLEKMGDDDRKVYDMVARRFLAVFHPEAVFENTRVETTVAEHVFRTRGKVLIVPGWRGVYGEFPRVTSRVRGGRGPRPAAPEARAGRGRRHPEGRAAEKETKPPRRYSDASLLGAMETAGKLVDDDELREAMKESGIGTPATRAAIIERLIDVGYVERDARALVPPRRA